MKQKVNVVNPLADELVGEQATLSIASENVAVDVPDEFEAVIV
jgi:hypothetical protein